MSRIISKNYALKYRTKRAEAVVALSMCYALKNKGRITCEEFSTLEKAARGARVYYGKKLKPYTTKKDILK